MKLSAKIYVILISIIGISVGIYCLYVDLLSLSQSSDLEHELVRILIFFVLSYLCRCLPIYIRDDYSIDMGFIGNFAMILSLGPYVTTAIVLIESVFMVVPTSGPKKEFKHIFNTPPIKSAFNTANFCLSVFLSGKVYLWAGGIAGNISFPGVLIPAIAMIFVIFLVNSVLLNILFNLNLGTPFLTSEIQYSKDFFPSVFAAAPIGYFISMFMSMQSGEYLVVLFILPLLLTRYSFTLYIEAKRNYYIMLKTLTYSIEAKDDYTRGHSERVERYAKILSAEMHLSHGRTDNIAVAALLHDVGKIGVDESILNKPAGLSDDERRIIEKHPEISVHILKEVKLDPLVFEMILHHHERYDGKGYPSGLLGEDLPIDVFVLSVADTYDAMTSTRPYSSGLSDEQAKQVIIDERGKQFHPKVVDAFVKAYDKGKMVLIERNPERELFFV